MKRRGIARYNGKGQDIINKYQWLLFLENVAILINIQLIFLLNQDEFSCFVLYFVGRTYN